ncbi:MAG: CapA family protein [Deltaproteobacteria bacterium]|nr:CapA family protein [Deltaproteobacteria bacterium]
MNVRSFLNIRFLVVFTIGYLLPVIAFVLVLSDRRPWSTDVALKGVPGTSEGKIAPVINAVWSDVDGIIAFTGDIMQHARQKGGDFDRSYSLIREELGAADIVIGNLEFPIERSRPTGPKLRTGIFNGEMAHLDALAKIGFDGLSIANNHIFDCGVTGLNSTLGLLKERNVIPVGLADPRQGRVPLLQPAVFDVNGIRVAVCGATYTINVPKDPYPPEFPVLSLPFHDWRDDYREFGRTVFTQSAMSARVAGAQMLFLFAHWGQEWNFSPMPSQMDASYDAFEAGFDMIIGSHTHVIGPVKKVKEKFVVTSVGNFVSDFREREVTVGAVAYVGMTSKGGISRLGLLPVFIVRNDGQGRPLHLIVPLNQRRKAELLRTLTRYGVRDAEQRWHFCKILSARVFGAYRLDEPPQRR